MGTEDNSGRVTLYRVPRPVVTTALVAVCVFLFHLFGVAERISPADAALYVERGLDGLVVISSYFGWHSIAAALKSKDQGHIGDPKGPA